MNALISIALFKIKSVVCKVTRFRQTVLLIKEGKIMRSNLFSMYKVMHLEHAGKFA